MRNLYNIKNILRTILTGCILMTFVSANAQIKIGTNGNIISPASLLELESANQGLLLPRLADTAAINALSPPNGMLIYLTKAPAVGLYVRKVTGWEYLTGSLAGNGNFNSLTVANTVTAGTFSGPLNGNATSATTAITATNATNATITNDLTTTNPTFPTFVTQSPGNTGIRTSSTNLSYVPFTGILTAKGFNGPLVGDVTGNALTAGDAQNTVNIRVNDDNSNAATVYPTWVAGITGPYPARVSSTKLAFMPLTGELTATTFKGALVGNASSATTVSGNVAAINGGTGQSIYTTGDLLYASSSIALSRLSALGMGGRVLRVNTVTGLPAWELAGAGTVQSVTGTANRIIIPNNDPTVSPTIDISPNYTGQASITTVGALSSGSLTTGFTPVGAAQGGTGLATLPPNVLVGNGTSSVTTPGGAANIGYVLTSTGATTPPTYQAAAAGDMVLAAAQSVTGNKTFLDTRLILEGSGLGLTTLKADANANGTVTFPAGNRILATIDGPETFTGVKTFSAVGGTSFTTPISFTSASGTSVNLTGTATAASFVGPLTGNATTATNTTNVDDRTAIFIADQADAVFFATQTNTAGQIVRRDGSGNFSASTITATLNGNANNVTGTVAIANGGTGAVTKTAGFNALSPMTTEGDLIYGGATGSGARLPHGASNTFLKTGVGPGFVPTWSTVDLSSADVTAILTPAKGGTGVDNTGKVITLGGNLTTNSSVSIISASQPIDFGLVNGNGGIQDISFTVNGVVDGDPISLGVPATAMVAGAVYTAFVSNSNEVTIRFTNTTAGALDPTAVPVNFKIKVVQ